MTWKKIAATIALASASFTVSTHANALEYKADETEYPVIFAHGLFGWDSLAGYNYFGEDLWGTFIGDACSFMELNGCNDWIAHGQQTNDKAERFQVSSMRNSEHRGAELFDHVQSFLATTGYTKVNLVGHSQGGYDIRKAAHLLKASALNGVPAGEIKVGAMISISTPHRGTGYAQSIYDQWARNEENLFCGILPPLPDGKDACWSFARVLADNLFDFLNGPEIEGNSLVDAGMQLIYDDYEPDDGIITGMKAFNQNYPSEGVAGYVGSIVTGQDNLKLSPLMAGLGIFLTYNADGDGYCVDDCDGDGAAGQGDGTTFDMDDDGLVPINSQQMGYRLQYNPDDCAGLFCVFGNPLDTITEVASTGYVADLNNPSAIQMTSHEGRLNQDHMDVISIGPDDLDEEEFYAAIFDFIESKGY
jgi:pimeloyl-ACP methyl ester carboxylesterase